MDNNIQCGAGRHGHSKSGGDEFGAKNMFEYVRWGMRAAGWGADLQNGAEWHNCGVQNGTIAAFYGGGGGGGAVYNSKHVCYYFIPSWLMI